MTRQQAIARNYLLRLRAMRAEMLRRLAAAYAAKLQEAEIRASYAAFTPIAARTITAGQGGAQTLTRAYLRGVSGELAPSPDLAGKSEKGKPIAEALIGIMPFILGAIAKGSTPPEALTIGGNYVDRLADNEFTRVVDGEIKWQAGTGRFIGWVGTVYGATDECVGNAGFHSFDEEMFRHPNCRCDREVALQGSTEPFVTS